MVRFDMPSSRTNAKKGSKTVRIKTTKAEKKGFTVALAASASGEKLPAVVIFKERGGVLGARAQRQLHVPNNVRVFASANEWMTRELYERWLRGTFGPGDEHQKRLLIVDMYRPHIAAESQRIVRDECHSQVIFVPGGCTSIVQAMDRSVNRPFKTSIRESWAAWMKGDAARTVHGNLKQPSRNQVIAWVSKAWNDLNVDVLVKAFLVCGISNAMDGSEDDLVDDDVPQVDINAEIESDSGEEDSDTDDDVAGLGEFDEEDDE